MARVKTARTTRARHKKVLKQAKGYFGSKHRLYKTAQEQVMHSGKYAYRDRKQKKRDFRKLWIVRINAACRMNDISYSQFINGLNKSGIEINRKMLSELAIDNAAGFTSLVVLAKEALNGKVVKAETKEVKAEAKEVATEDFSKLTVAELKELAKSKNIEVTSSMKKADILELLK